MTITIASAVNNEEVLNQCLLRSPDLKEFASVVLRRGYANAALAYNPIIHDAKTDVIVFVHQDMYFPEGWFNQLRSAVANLQVSDPDWGVLGIWGVNQAGAFHGHLYCSGNRRILGHSFDEPVKVRSLDEVVLIIRTGSGIKFDEKMGGFHFYGTDLCLTAAALGMASYVVPGFCVHNTNGYGLFPRAFWTAYFYMRRKWEAELPVKTSCIEITRSLRPFILATAWRYCWLRLKNVSVAERVEDPAALFADISGAQTHISH